MNTTWDELAEQYQALIGGQGPFARGEELHSRDEAAKRLLGRLASELPKDNPLALGWFISGLKRESHKWFIARAMSLAKPLPSSMINPLLVAALMEENPSANRIFVEPCVRAVGASEVASRVALLGEQIEVGATAAVERVLYWVHRAGP